MRATCLIACFTLLLLYNGKAQDISKDTLPNKADSIESTFKGGSQAWRIFMIKNHKLPQFFMDKVDNAKVSCMVSFKIDTTGRVQDIQITQSGCCGTNEEAIRVINTSSGLWIPATIGGKPVESYKKQPFTYTVENSTGSPNSSLEELKEQYEKWLRKHPK